MLHSKVQIIDEMEAAIPRWIEARNPEWYPTFVHVLRIDPDRTDRVDLTALWQPTTAGGEAGGDASPAAAPGQSSKVEARLAAMQAQLDRLEQLLSRKEGVSSS